MNPNQNYRNTINIHNLRNDIRSQNAAKIRGYATNFKNLRANIKVAKNEIALIKTQQKEIRQHPKIQNILKKL